MESSDVRDAVAPAQQDQAMHDAAPTAQEPAPSPTQTRDTIPSISLLQSPEQIHAQIPKYTPPKRAQPSAGEDGRRPNSSYATGGTIEIPQAVFPPTRSLSASSQTAPKSPEQRRISTSVHGDQTEPKAEPLATVNEEQEVTIKQENMQSPLEAPAQAEQEYQSSKTVSTLKQEHASRTQSPLRESSLARPTTEASPNPTNMKKRPAPARKKGTATAAKKARGPTKKRKIDTVKSSGRGSGKGTPAPSSPSHSAGDYDEDDESEVDSDEDVEGSGDVYCLCRKPDNGTFMIGCDGGCDDWFHGKCVHIEERDKNLIDKYICPRCTQAGIGRTSWKRMCRRPGCRQPARVGRNAGKNGETSKYCSDDCGVLFFRQMTAHSRGVEQKERGRRKSTAVEERHDTGAKGGILSIGEVRAMLDQTNSATEFRELGNGVLSPPATPKATSDEEDMTELEKDAVNTIVKRKEEARQRHQMLKDRQRFITMVKNEAGKLAAEKELKPKEFCGFDSRLEWSEEEFAEWRQTVAGQKVFEQDSLEPANDETMKDVDAVEVCSRKKCARHTEWAKLMVDEVRFEMTDNSDRMRELEQEERDVRDRAAIRVKTLKFGGDEGQVEMHNVEPAGINGITPMEVDPVV